MVDRSTGLRVRIERGKPFVLDATLACSSGEVLALVGPSGSGKSTLLRCIAGLATPDRGHIHCNGETWLDSASRKCLPTGQRRIGMVFQSYALFPHLTALENIMEGIGAGKPGPKRERARELLRVVHLAGLEDRKPHQLSGGQQQRVAVARALARDPRVLLLDEPFAAVDRSTREKLYGELAELRRRIEIPVILVTHDLDEAAMLADRITILSRGRTLQTGTPDELMRRPVSVEVARLTGMKNLFEGRVLRHCAETGTTRLRWGELDIEAALQERYPPGTEVAWGIPAADVLLPPLDHSPRGSRDNPVTGTIAQLLTLGDRVRVSIQLAEGTSLSMSVARHVCTRYSLAEGKRTTVRLRGEGIHLMPLDGSLHVPTQ